jgi:CheY-like chemotaxis protein
MEKKIVVIDDQPDILYVVKSILVRKGYDVATDSTDAILENMKENYPDLIILDVNLEEMDGGDICHKLKTQESTKHIPIILMSAIMDLPKISDACGADDYLNKPFQSADLLDMVKKNLQAA